jgi:hypothetical protein
MIFPRIEVMKKPVLIGIITVSVSIAGLVLFIRQVREKTRQQKLSAEVSAAQPTAKISTGLKTIRREGGGSVDHIEADNYESNAEQDYGMDEVVLKNGERIRSLGYQVGYLGEISGGRKPILILRGRECYECGAPMSIHLYSIAESKTVELLTYPGKLHDIVDGEENPAVVVDSKQYMGTCLSGKKSVYVLLSRSLNSQKEWEMIGKAYTANPDGSLKTESINYNTPITTNRDCREISPQNTFSD